MHNYEPHAGIWLVNNWPCLEASAMWSVSWNRIENDGAVEYTRSFRHSPPDPFHSTLSSSKHFYLCNHGFKCDFSITRMHKSWYVGFGVLSRIKTTWANRFILMIVKRIWLNWSHLKAQTQEILDYNFRNQNQIWESYIAQLVYKSNSILWHWTLLSLIVKTWDIGVVNVL